MLDMATGTPHGLLGYALSAEMYQTATGAAVPHAPPQDPGPLPENATGVAVTTHKYLQTAFLSDQQAIKKAKATILASLSDEAKSLLADPMHGVRRIDLKTMLDRLRAEYGTLTAHDLEQQKNILLVPYPLNTPIRDYVRRHTEVANTLRTANQPLSSADRVLHLRAGVRHHPPFASAVQHYLTSYPSVAAQSFTGLADALAQAEDNSDPTPTTGTTGYSAAATPLPTAFSTTELTKMINEAVAAAMRERRSPRTPKPPPNFTHYCWTHGPCSHTSSDCRAPSPGHIKDATDSDRRGGAAVNPRYAK